jgi:hypothetical protein
VLLLSKVQVDTVIIVATDVAGNEAEQPITVSVKMIGLSTSVVWSGIGDDNKVNANEMAATTALYPLTRSNNSLISPYSQQQQPYIPLLAATTALYPLTLSNNSSISHFNLTNDDILSNFILV